MENIRDVHCTVYNMSIKVCTLYSGKYLSLNHVTKRLLEYLNCTVENIAHFKANVHINVPVLLHLFRTH